MSQISTYHWSLDRDLLEYSRAGYRAMGAWRRKLEDFGEAQAVKLIRQSKMDISSLQWAGGFTGSDGRSHEESIEDGLLAVRLASQIGADCLVLITGGRAGHTLTHAQRLTRVAIEALRGLARKCKVRLVIEPMHPACTTDWTYLHSLPAAIELLESLEPPQNDIGVLFDTFHLLEPNMEIDFPREWTRYLGLVRVGDRTQAPEPGLQRTVPGQGRLPITNFLHWLRAGQYSGYVEFETFGDETEDLGYAELLRLCREVVPWQA